MKKSKSIWFILVSLFLVVSLFLTACSYFIKSDNSEDSSGTGGVWEIETYTLEIVADAPTEQEIDAIKQTISNRAKEYFENSNVSINSSNQIILAVPKKEIVDTDTDIINNITRQGILQFQDSDGNIFLSNSDIQKAEAVEDTNNGMYAVSITLTADGTYMLSQVTKDNIGKPISIYLDGMNIQTATVMDQITNGECWISGMADKDEAENMAALISTDSLPYELTVVPD